MAKLKEIYEGSENTDIQLLIDILCSFKAKSIYECKDVINGIKETLNYLKKYNTYLGKLEKLRILYSSFPVYLKIRLHPRGNEDVDNNIKDVYDILNFQIYLKQNAKYNFRTEKPAIHEDYMDIYLIFKNNGGFRGKRPYVNQKNHFY